MRVIHGDCLAAMRDLAADGVRVQAVVTDPPYGLTFMGREWDKGVPGAPFWAAALALLPPGGHLLAFGGTRTFHRIACAIEDAGFEVRDTLAWLYGSGYPKSKHHLKPAWEPIILARKPLAGTLADNLLVHGVGGLNTEACRVAGTPESPGTTPASSVAGRRGSMAGAMDRVAYDASKGRWPPNLAHDGSAEVEAAFAAFGDKTSGRLDPHHKFKASANTCMSGGNTKANPRQSFGGDTGSASRFFYSAKASAADRCGSKHPTVKPQALLRWLARMVTPPGGTILDPFAGSGSMGTAAAAEGFDAILIEREAEYIADIRARLAATPSQGDLLRAMAG